MVHHSCPECRRMWRKTQLVLAWAAWLAGAAGLLGAAAALIDAFAR